jgi:type IV pilus assembly protein PilV
MKNNRQDKGYSLLEVLIALVILAIGLLGLAGLQMQGLKDNHSSQLRSQATFLAADIIDRMQANRARALDGDYDIDFGETVNATTTMAQSDLSNWKNGLNALLPSGDGSIDVVDGTVTVRIGWQDVSENDNATVFRTDTRL